MVKFIYKLLKYILTKCFIHCVQCYSGIICFIVKIISMVSAISLVFIIQNVSTTIQIFMSVLKKGSRTCKNDRHLSICLCIVGFSSLVNTKHPPLFSVAFLIYVLASLKEKGASNCYFHT